METRRGHDPPSEGPHGEVDEDEGEGCEDDDDDEGADDDDDDEGADDERQHVCSDLTLFHAAQRVEDQIALAGHLLIIRNHFILECGQKKTQLFFFLSKRFS